MANEQYITPEEKAALTQGKERVEGSVFAGEEAKFINSLRTRVLDEYKAKSPLINKGNEQLAGIEKIAADRPTQLSKATELLQQVFGTNVLSPDILGSVASERSSLIRAQGKTIEDALKAETEKMGAEFTKVFDVPFERLQQSSDISERINKEDYNNLIDVVKANATERAKAAKASAAAKKAQLDPAAFISDALGIMDRIKGIDEQVTSGALDKSKGDILKVLTIKSLQDAYKGKLTRSEINQSVGASDDAVESMVADALASLGATEYGTD